MFRLALRPHAAEDLDFAGLALGQEEVAVGGGANEAGIIEAGGIEFDFETLRGDGQYALRPWNDGGAVVNGLLRGRSGQIGDGQVATDAGGLMGRVGEGGLAGKNGVRGSGLRWELGVRGRAR